MTECNPTTNEIWKPVPEWEGIYEVSSHGRVRRVLKGAGVVAPRIMVGTLTAAGYRTVYLRHNKRSKYCVVHKMVAAAFIGPRPVGREINHINAVKTDNRYENLEYVTHKQNQEHASRLGLMNGVREFHWMRSFPERMPRGENRPCAKLTPEKVRAIRLAFEGGRSRRQLAKTFNVSHSTINSIVARRTWNHI